MAAERPLSQIRRARDFGAFITIRMNELDLKPGQVARKMPMAPSTLSRILSGESGPPKDETIARLAEVLKVDLVKLMHIAGRGLDPRSLEAMVFERFDRVLEALKEQDARLERIETAIARIVDS